MRLGTKRKTFSEYVCAVARSTATLASTTSIGPRLRTLGEVETGGGVPDECACTVPLGCLAMAGRKQRLRWCKEETRC